MWRGRNGSKTIKPGYPISIHPRMWRGRRLDDDNRKLLEISIHPHMWRGSPVEPKEIYSRYFYSFPYVTGKRNCGRSGANCPISIHSRTWRERYQGDAGERISLFLFIPVCDGEGALATIHGFILIFIRSRYATGKSGYSSSSWIHSISIHSRHATRKFLYAGVFATASFLFIPVMRRESPEFLQPGLARVISIHSRHATGKCQCSERTISR